MKIVKSLLVVAMLSASIWALPPQVEADKLALGAKASIDTQDFKGALEKLEKLGSLNVKLPDAYWYYYGSTLLSLGRGEEAIDAFDKYLEQGAKAKYYKEALGKYDEAENSIKKNAPFIDSKTGLMWQDDGSEILNSYQSTWYAAKDYCENLTVVGKSDWYLPTSEQLLSLYYKKNQLKNSQRSFFWSSSENSSKGINVYFEDGSMSSALGNYYALPVRCVRNNK